MGQIPSSPSSLKADVLSIQEKLHTFNKATFLKYEELVRNIKELNALTRTLTDRSGKQLCFSIKKGTDSSVLWKTTIRIRCLKVDTASSTIQSSRLLNLHQYVAMRKEILHQIQAIATHSAAMEVKDHGCASDLPSTSQGNEFLASAYFTAGDKLNLDQPNEDLNECCVCMDNKACIMLSCSHEFCEACIDNWTKDKKHSNCPLCRTCVKGADDTWVLTDKCDSEDYENEVKGYLVGLADRK